MNPVPNVIPGVPDTTFASPPDRDYADLPVARVGEHRVSRWQPTERERKAIAEGGDVWLLVVGAQPPVLVTGEAPVLVEEEGHLVPGFPTDEFEGP